MAKERFPPSGRRDPETDIAERGRDPSGRLANDIGDALTAEERQDVAFHAFPLFFFRVKRRGGQPVPTAEPNAAEKYIYGFVFCRQRQDASLRRGGEQLSVLVLSEHPFSSVLRPLSQAAGQMFFSHGKAALEQLYHEVSGWPPPVAGPLLQLQAGQTNIQARLPSMHTLPHPSSSLDSEQSRGSRIASGSILAELEEASPPPDAVARAGGVAGPSSFESLQSSTSLSALAAGAAQGGLSRGGSLPQPRFSGSKSGFVFAKAALPTSNSAGNRNWSLDQVRHGGSSGALAVTTGQPDGEAGAVNGDGAASGGDAGQAGGTSSSESNVVGPAASSGGQAAQIQRRVSVGLGNDGQTPVQGAFCEVDIYSALRSHLLRLWQLWEMALLGKPLLVVGLSPADACNATAALVALISPLPFRPDFRPYFTIHDTSFRALSSGQMPDEVQPDGLPCLVGVTNPYFIKVMSHWPSVLSVGQKEQSTWSGAAAGAAAAATAAVLNPGAAVKALTQRMRGAQSLLSAHSEGLWSTYRPLVRPDDILLARLLKPQAGDVRSKLARIAVVNNEALRRHFYELTTALLAPFSRYFEPGPESQVPRWDAAAFLASLSASGAQHPALLSERFARPSDLIELYSRFTSSANFRFYLELHQRPLAHMLAPEPLPVGLPVVGPTGKPLEEVELLDCFFESELKLQELEAQPCTAPNQRQEVTRLRRLLASLFFGMPEDLQWTCISSPSRRQLLASLQAELNSEQQQTLQRLVARLK